MAAVLACGPEAVLSHESAAALWGLRDRERAIELSVPRARRATVFTVHRRRPEVLADATTRDRIPVTSPLRALVDLAVGARSPDIERLVNQADKLDLIDPETLRGALVDMREPGVPALRKILDTATFVLTDTELERLFVPIARRAGLPKPRTQRYLGDARVDFHWRELDLVVETDGLRYHRTPAQQARDIERDNEHRACSRVPVRFTHDQVKHRPHYVEQTLVAIVRTLGKRGDH
jgi:very-short-patch-repair endonuclease